MARLNNADMALWQQVEKPAAGPVLAGRSLPSAQTALRLGYKQVADAIRDEVTDFLARLPALINLLFNDRTPFVSEQTNSGWHHPAQSTRPSRLYRPMKNYRRPRRASMKTGWKPRCGKTCPKVIPATSFTASFGAQLLEEAGMVQLAQQQYRMLFRTGLHDAIRMGAFPAESTGTKLTAEQ